VNADGVALLAGRSAIVTGAGQGLGRAVAIRLASAGASVVVNDIDAGRAEDTARAIASAGGRALAVTADIAVEADVERMVRSGVDEFGSVDLACNNAIPPVQMQSLHELDASYAQTMMDVALFGTAMCLKHEIGAMRGGSGGAIVNIASTASPRGQESTGFYSACKAGVEALTRVAANENGPQGIRVNAIQAGAMLTPALRSLMADSDVIRSRMERAVPLRRIAEPEEVADVALFLLSDLARYVTGAVVTADGGGILHTSSIEG
jgi:NAD(P)-dependent dehydrogenase (short-subunit alcohol dehydrogenase family)